MKRRQRQQAAADLLLGAHMSIAGGVDLAPLRGKEVGCQTMQLFTKSSNQWRARPLPPDEIERYRANLLVTGIAPVVAHDSYLINLASTDSGLHRKSMAGFLEELERAEALGVQYLVTHPGAHMGAGEETGLRQVATSIRELLKQTKSYRVQVVIETAAGQGTSLGHNFEQIAVLLDQIGLPERTGVCLDTCHIFAAGYDIRTPDGYADVIGAFDAAVGIPHLKVIHLNDSKKELGCRVDRHEHIGKGNIGLEAFRCLLADSRLKGIPMILETPKDDDFVLADRRNLATLRRLAEGPDVS
ncbi:MAG: deoxyribonuclease IV [Candidatus Methylomirabilis oxyfera]|nr:deoxyribonuclease IV [Candidatus Methylomirabilis oxyfera]